MIKILNDGTSCYDNYLLGYVGEHNSRVIDIEYPVFKNATHRLYFDVGNPNPYFIGLTGNNFVADHSLLKSAGEVDVQFIAMDENNEIIFKSEVFKMEVKKSIEGTPEACPTYEQSEDLWNKLNGYTVNQPEIVDGFWHIFNTETNQYENTGVKAEGNDGAPGFNPTITEKQVPQQNTHLKSPTKTVLLLLLT